MVRKRKKQEKKAGKERREEGRRDEEKERSEKIGMGQEHRTSISAGDTVWQ